MAKLLPDGERLFSLEAEAAVLGSMIIDKGCIPEVLAIITKTEMLYRPEHQVIFDALVSLHIKRGPIDAVVLRTKLVHAKRLEGIGGVAYLGKIMGCVPSADNAVYYAKIVRGRYVYRNMVDTVHKMSNVPNEPGEVNEQIAEIHRLALSLEIDKDDEAHEFKDKVVESVVSHMDKKNCLATGFPNVDRIIAGFSPWEFIVLAGRPGMGKTAFALDVSMALAKKDEKVLIFSLEMGHQALMSRAACAEAFINPNAWDGVPPKKEFDALLDMAQRLEKRDVTIYETVETPEKMHAIAQMHARTKGLDLIVIDYIQIMSTSRHYESENTRISTISRKLKRMGMDLQVPVLAMSQLNRECESRRNHMPRLSDLRGSGSLEQDADMVLFLHREDQYRKTQNPDVKPEDLDGIAKLIVAKNRNGRTGIAQLLFREEYTTFKNLVAEQGEFEETKK